MNSEICKIRGKYHFYDGTEEGLWLTKEDVTLTREQIEAMSDEELKLANEKVKEYACGITNDIEDYIIANWSYLKQAAKSLQWLKDNKDPHPFWRVKAAIELVTLRIPFKTYKFTQGLNIEIGDTSTDLFCFKMLWDKKEQRYRTEHWYRTYNKPRKLTPEEQAERDREWRAKQEKKRQERWKRNYERLGCKENWLDRKFKHKDGEIFTLTDLNPRDKKFPYSGHIDYPEGSSKKSSEYSISTRYFKEFKNHGKRKESWR